MPRSFAQVDVFTTTPYAGNPVAVVLDAEGLSTEEMERVARWTNLSETTFVLPPSDPQADYQVRIFTSARLSTVTNGSRHELPFAGHPTLGTCHAWLEAGGTPRRDDVIVQQCAIGLVPVRRADEMLAFAAPPLIRSGAVDEALLARVAAQLGIAREEIVAAEWVDNGPGWLGVLLASAEAVLALRPGVVEREIGVVGLYPPGAPQAIELRAFIPKDGATTEDPVTGSLNASVAGWLLRTGRVSAPYVASQGTALDRAGRVHVSQDPDATLWVGGGTVTCIRGDVEL